MSIDFISDAWKADLKSGQVNRAGHERVLIDPRQQKYPALDETELEYKKISGGDNKIASHFGRGAVDGAPKYLKRVHGFGFLKRIIGRHQKRLWFTECARRIVDANPH